jgi:hypothetical protein
MRTVFPVLAENFSGRLKPRAINGIGRKLKPEGSGFIHPPQEGRIEMKSSRKALCVSVLMLAPIYSAFAGDIHHPAAPPPPPPTSNGIIHTGATGGEIRTDEAVSTPEATDTITEAALNLLLNLLTLF